MIPGPRGLSIVWYQVLLYSLSAHSRVAGFRIYKRALAERLVGHLLAALVFGQQVASFNPLSEVILANTPPPIVETIFNFSGGLFSALVFYISTIVLFRKPRGPSLFWLGVPFMFATFFELINGLIEGFFKCEYILAIVYYPSTYGRFLTSWAALTGLLFAFIVYYGLSRTKPQRDAPD
jgi:hypothetical protein